MSECPILAWGHLYIKKHEKTLKMMKMHFLLSLFIIKNWKCGKKNVTMKINLAKKRFKKNLCFSINGNFG